MNNDLKPAQAVTARIWRRGPPPHIGWWNASTDRGLDIWRWWNGTCWSRPALEKLSASKAAIHANEDETNTWPIEWTEYWPENARVPRLDPAGGHWTFNTGTVPVGVQRAEVVFRDGLVQRNARVTAYDWLLDGQPFDIVAWRPACA